MSRLTRNGTAESVSRNKFLRRERGQRKKKIPCSADHKQDWRPYPVDLYYAGSPDHTIHTVGCIDSTKQEQGLSTLIILYIFI